MSIFGKIASGISNLGYKAKQHSPELLLVAGGVSFVATVVSVYRARPKFEKVLKEHNDNLEKAKETYEAVQKQIEEGKAPVTPYTKEDYKRDRMHFYMHFAVDTAKIFGPSVIFGASTIGCVGGAFGIINARFLGVSAALASEVKTREILENNIVSDYGKEALEKLKEPRPKTIVEETVNEETGEVETTVKYDTSSNDGLPPYARFFDSSCNDWDEDPENNRIFLYTTQNILNHRLQKKGHLYLNEVYEALGFEETKAGRVMGWVYYKNPEDAQLNGSDNFVDLGVGLGSNSRFVNGLENVVIINPNVDRLPIIDRIGLATI